ncbi:SpoIIE family protein phosphatase [Actinoplanes aureus]|uniref:SpoIIE family protein phosphatase n=1 Tax=Actinoplanes aureus TaxID=2792083 RepID=A0A931C4Z8_9ACTN|nr:SpoIIE family protein phosphatase [Actinoplanes aureus]MBG0561482.1 SpoIIE family protein phosphatase [Actinoplanes aureus]
MKTDQGYQHRLNELEAKIGRARLDPVVVCERAAGLLAGRIGCRVDEAHTHLRQLAAEQDRDVHEVAADALAALEARGVTPPAQLRTAADALTRHHRTPSPRPDPLPQPDPVPPTREWTEIVQQVLDALPGRRTLVAPERDPDGLIVDYRFVAVSSSVVDLSGRRREDLLGRRVSEVYPSIVDGPVWAAWRDALADRQPREVGPVPYVSSDDDSPTGVTVTVHVQPLGDGLLNSWVRHDEQTRLAERMAHTERLGNLGWGEWDLVTDTTVWSDELYRIYERDPADGPMPREESEALVLPDDDGVRKQAAVAFGRGETADLLYRIRVNGRIKHLRAVVDAVRDAGGRPLKIYGILQDVTARESSRVKLAQVERQLREHQESLAIEHRLAAQLQQIVLPIPDAPIDLPGIRVAVRYLPAERASRVGGDWYHAAVARDGSVVLAVGDVAGHGVQAAATMAQLRHTLTALTVTTTTHPAELLSNLNELLYAGDAPDGTATAVILRFDPATRQLRWAQAGHPAPLHTRAGVTTELARPYGPLLGALPDPGYDTAGITIEHDDVVVIYTDGLVEHRSHSLAEGLVPVVARLNRFSAEEQPASLAGLLAELHTANPDDDTCILAARCLERRHG